MKKDIKSRKDIEQMVALFYKNVVADDVIGFIFTDIVKMNWESHLPLMCDFWENAVFFTGSYSGNPMNLHKHLHHIRPLESKHFQQWIYLFAKTVDSLFKGKNANLIKQRAISIAQILEAGVLQYRNEHDAVY